MNNKPIQVLLRHCTKPNNSKPRPEWFSYQYIFDHFKKYANPVFVDITILLDGKIKDHYIKYEESDNVIETEGGSDAASLLNVLDYFKHQNWDDETIVYILEDDYIHEPGWVNIMLEAFNETNVDYVTLYDHPDKYWPMYEQLMSKIIHTTSIHWRTTPSTTNTYACKAKTLRKHWDIHEYYCLPEHTHGGYDHTKFTRLWQEGSNLISCIPGYASHCEVGMLSPTIKYSNESK